jgi:hypothetical protein
LSQLHQRFRDRVKRPHIRQQSVTSEFWAVLTHRGIGFCGADERLGRLAVLVIAKMLNSVAGSSPAYFLPLLDFMIHARFCRAGNFPCPNRREL